MMQFQPTGPNANWSVINSGYSTTNMFPLEHRKADTYGESWTLLYKAIRYCNIFLQNYEKVPWSDWEEASYHANEARALRAYFYWLLVRTYGGVPLIMTKCLRWIALNYVLTKK